MVLMGQAGNGRMEQQYLIATGIPTDLQQQQLTRTVGGSEQMGLGTILCVVRNINMYARNQLVHAQLQQQPQLQLQLLPQQQHVQTSVQALGQKKGPNVLNCSQLVKLSLMLNMTVHVARGESWQSLNLKLSKIPYLGWQELPSPGLVYQAQELILHPGTG